MHNHFVYNPLEQTDKRFLGFTTMAIIGGIAAAAWGVSSTQNKRRASDRAEHAQDVAGQERAAQQASYQKSQAQPARVGTQEATEKKRRSVGRRSKTRFTSPLGLSASNRSEANLKTLTGQ